MSLGAIDFGLIVDSSVIMIENCMRQISHRRRPSSLIWTIVRDAAIEVRKPTMFGELIIAVVYLPILALQGTEGKLFRPMALTVLFALAGSLDPVVDTDAGPGLIWACRAAWRKRKSGWFGSSSGSIIRSSPDRSVHPSDHDVALTASGGRGQHPGRLESRSRIHAATGRRRSCWSRPCDCPVPRWKMRSQCRRRSKTILREFPEVKTVFCKTGRPEIANDVMGVHQTDVWVMLHPREEWPEDKDS